VHEDDGHHYLATCAWSGSTGAGYAAYDRSHRGTVPPATSAIELSADPAFRGDPALANPEQLLVLAAASCQLLSFLAVAARARLDVVAYEDRAEGLMPASALPPRITRVLLHPRIVVRPPATEERVRALVETAHRECFIANSLRADVEVFPEIEIVEIEIV
jgi:organic hydroperoxide reductase OsmC/OhrA